MGVLETRYNEVMEKPLKILEIFNEFFGEARVDMQGFISAESIREELGDSPSIAQIRSRLQSCTGFILVHFPQVTITNENNRSVSINHLYAKVCLNIRGEILGRFSLNRSEYTLLHLDNNYMHSHVNSIPFDSPTAFQQPCTGSGPINNTICSLSYSYDEDLWRLFCLELDKYVRVESLAGVPYHRLEGLVRGGGGGGSLICTSMCIRNAYRTVYSGRFFPKTLIVKFIKHLIDNEVLNFHYIGGEFKVAASPVETAIKVSNCFIDFYNREYSRGDRNLPTRGELINQRIIIKCKYSEGKLYREGGSSTRDYSNFLGARICDFKGTPVRIDISDYGHESDEEENEVFILDPSLIEYAITKILNIIDFRYGNEQCENTPNKKAIIL